MERSQRILSQLLNKASSPVSKDTSDDVVIVSAVRTAIGRSKGGYFFDEYVENMLAHVMKHAVSSIRSDLTLIGDIVVGSVLGSSLQRANECRMAAFLAGLPQEVPIHTVNRQCSSGLQALAEVAANIKAGYYDVGLACGVEKMSVGPLKWEGSINPLVKSNKDAAACLVPMGITSENVAAKYNISRHEQDELSAMSHKRAALATKSGRFRDEIVPMEVTVTDKEGKKSIVLAATDEGIREDTTLEGLSKLKPVFKADGSTTAGNASQVCDGAAAVLAMRRRVADKLGLKILGVFRSYAVVGVDPLIMGVGPGYAIPKAVALAGLKLSDIDLFEINEAFASQAVWTVKHLGLSWDNVNVNGGAIALGHPLGMTGARMTATLLHEMAKRKSRFGVVSMCVGSGMGAAAVFERTP